ncbi:MAG: exonuclease domain-containing protein [Chloroflexi bacterium]|nr:exonuclease domain-containing protein [Chloroflexota bacterium]
MRGELIAFDLETTGLDVARSEIIEIGMARFDEGELIDSYQTFVKPSGPIPVEITHLTGIHPEDVEHAPPIEQILEELRALFGSAPVIAHNAGFDVSFMRKHGLLPENAVIDTLELAAIVLPSAPRYNLNSLATGAGIQLKNAHRALDDATATGQLYWSLWQKLLRLPYTILAEIVNAAGAKQWDLLPLFQAALSESLQAGTGGRINSPFFPEEPPGKPLKPSQASHSKVDVGRVRSMFEASGDLGLSLPAYEARGEQAQMACEVATALNEGDQVLIEAGTGTGKSLAYLLPAAQWATWNDQRVVVSTHTINLQEQLLNKDMPIVHELINRDLQASIMKGRGNYLCPRRLDMLRRRKPANLEELRTLAKVLVWMQNGCSGDRGDLSLRAGEWHTWARLSAQDEDCTSYRCTAEMNGVCPYYRARRRAETAHILITNHALLIADANIENRVLPEYLNLIIDEAHHLEDAITDGLSRRIDEQLILARLREIGGGRSSSLRELLTAASSAVPAADLAKLERFVENTAETLRIMNTLVRKYFRALHDFAASHDRDGRYQMRLLSSHRDSGSFANAQSAWKQLAEYFLAVADALGHLSQALPRYEQYQIPDLDDYRGEIRSHIHFLNILHDQLEGFTFEPDSNMVYSITPGDKAERLRIHISPLHVGPLMEEFLNQRKEGIILTSATLRTQGNFDHIKERLYADHYETVALGSPFDYERSTLVYVPDDIPEPNQRSAYQRMVERGIVELAAELEGRVLVLFTSYAQLRETSRAITPRLKLGDILVFDQSFGTSREALLESFKTAKRAVLMGTRSFWEGIDIPGEDLSAVVIARLPFAVPSDPIFSARSEAYENAFQQYAVPDAILRFRQGFGRLIRSSSDRGIVAVFDKRVISKNYGASFLESLPECTIRYGSLDNLPQTARQWLKLI